MQGNGNGGREYRYSSAISLGHRFTLEDLIVKQPYGVPDEEDFVAFLLQEGPSSENKLGLDLEVVASLVEMYRTGLVTIKGNFVKPTKKLLEKERD